MTENKQYYYVYKLFNPDCEGFYIGSTVSIMHRKSNHKKDCNNSKCERTYNLKVYKYIRANGGYDKWQYEILEHVRNSINIKELHNVERKYIEQLKPSLNCVIPNRTRVQRYNDNREAVLYVAKQKHQCICGGKYTNANKSNHFKTKTHRAFEQSN